MNALTTGGLIILYLLLVNSIAAVIVSGTNPDFVVAEGCESTHNTTECREISEASFVESVLGVSVQGITENQDIVNGLWVGVNVFLLTLAIILIVSYFIGLVFGGAS